MTTKFQNSKTGSVYRQWIISLVASIIFLTHGLQSGWISPFIILLQSESSPSGYPLSNYEIALIASANSILAITSAIIYGYLSDGVGRRIALMLIVIPQILGYALKLVSAHPICLIISQAFCGVGSGGVYSVAPAYIKEIAQDSLRGILGSTGILLQSIGVLIMYAMGAYINYYTVLWIVVGLTILNLIALFKVPESPAFLVKRGKIEEAIQVTAWLRGVDNNNKEVERDISINKHEMALYENLPPVTWKTILSNKVSRKGLGLAFLMVSLMDLGGYFAVLSYASVILRNAGVTIAPDLQAIALPALMTLGSLVSVVTIEKFGRKTLIITSAIISGGPLAVLGAMLLVQENGGYMPSWLPVVCIGSCLYASGQHMSLPYVVISEMFSIQLRTKILALLATYGWAICALQAIIFTPIKEYFGIHTLFFGYAFINLIGIVITYVTLPETKGKTQLQIDKELEGIR